jgi:signal transduction histidine kinase
MKGLPGMITIETSLISCPVSRQAGVEGEREMSRWGEGEIREIRQRTQNYVLERSEGSTLNTSQKVRDVVVIRITDNGCGMTQEVQQQIFDPFFTTKSVGTAVGLGLSVSYKIVVEKHGGQIRCHSVEGEGTTFEIELPVIT